jgi:hypothetical protein
MSTSTGFQHGCLVPSGCTPLATSTGGVHAPFSWRDTQMPTSGAPSRVPPNHAATSAARVSTIVDACALANGAVSKMNSDRTTASVADGCAADRPAATTDAPTSQNQYAIIEAFQTSAASAPESYASC